MGTLSQPFDVPCFWKNFIATRPAPVQSPLAIALLVLAAGVLASGCKKSPPPAAQPVLTLHWQGAAALGADTNAATLKRIWSLPESVKFQNQTLDKLATTPWTLSGKQPDTNAVALVRSLLNDLVRAESRFELAESPDQPLSWMLAIRLDPQRSRLWEQQLPSALKSLTDSGPQAFPGNRAGWVMRTQAERGEIGFCRSGHWTLFGRADGIRNFELAAARLLNTGPAGNRTNAVPWLHGHADLSRLAKILDVETIKRSSLPLLDLSVKGRGDGQRISTEARFTFAKPLDIELQPWNVPTNLIEKSQSSFTAVRGLAGCLTGWKAWKDLEIGPPPDQLFVWALRGQGYLSYFTAATPDPIETLRLVTDQVMDHQDDWFAGGDEGGFRRAIADGGLEWAGVPFMWPNLTLVETNGHTWVLGAGFNYVPPVEPIDKGFTREALAGEGLVYFDWEHSGERLLQWLYMGQFIRMVTHHAQLPFEVGSVPWIQAVSAEMGQAVTKVTVNSPTRLDFVRTSTLGFTAIELNLIAEWLESPAFPKGLHTFTAPRPEIFVPSAQTPQIIEFNASNSPSGK